MARPKGSKNGVHTLVTLTCGGCGEPFRVKPSKAGIRKYCSMACRRLGSRECEVCGADYYPKARAQRYCSRPCDAIARGGMSDITAENLLARTEQSGDCLLWTGMLKSSGYGVFRYRGKRLDAHRVSYAVCNGPIPDGMWVLHRCDTPACINPEHLWLGDAGANSRDMCAKGRHWRQRASRPSAA